MNYLLLPDFIAITLLVAILVLAGNKRSDSVSRLWTAGLIFIVLECAARIVYEMPLQRHVHQLAHAFALIAYGMAGALFVVSASRVLRRMPKRHIFFWSNILPHLALLAAYSFDVERAWVYQVLVYAGIAAGAISSAAFRRSWHFYAVFAAIWMPVLLCVELGLYRSAVYMTLFSLYALSATLFYRSLRRGSRGKIAVVAGFCMWALCFLTHPWIASAHPGWVDFVSRWWNMQKFVITTGLLLVFLEDEIRSNEWLALHDGLTGLPNRRLFEDRLQHSLLHAQRTGSRLALFTLDLNGFKQVNDSLGHDAGDVLLKGVSRNLLHSLRRSDTLARLGGDEFTLIAADLDGQPSQRTSPEAAPGRGCAASRLPQVQRILSAMAGAVEIPVPMGELNGGGEARISASIGVAIYPDEASNVEELMRLADKRMYASKAEGARLRRQKPNSNLNDYDLQRA